MPALLAVLSRRAANFERCRVRCELRKSFDHKDVAPHAIQSGRVEMSLHGR
jgi:hypothetical protein